MKNPSICPAQFKQGIQAEVGQSGKHTWTLEGNWAACYTMNLQAEVCRNCGYSELSTRDLNLVGSAGSPLPIALSGDSGCEVRICCCCGFAEWSVATSPFEHIQKEVG